VRSLVQMDAPDHPKYRALTQAWFMPRNIGGLDQRIRNIARASVERMAAKGGECDFVREVALHYPLHVVMEIEALLDELADHERTRHFMAHGYMDLSSDGRGGYKVLVRCFRPKSSTDPNEEQIRWTLEEMEAEANRASEFCGRWIRLQYDIHADFGWVGSVDRS
jgi:cytochrome P450